MKEEIPEFTMLTPEEWHEPTVRIRDEHNTLWGHFSNGLKICLESAFAFPKVGPKKVPVVVEREPVYEQQEFY